MKYLQSGVTLIEMMFVVLLIGLLALLATPLTGQWVNESRLKEAIGAMEQAIGQAKGVALRNSEGIKGDEAASKVCLTDGLLSVNPAKPAAGPTTPAEPADCVVGGPAALWSTKMPSNMTIVYDGPDSDDVSDGDWECACFSNKGVLTTEGPSCAACATGLNLTVAIGSGGAEAKDEKRDFY